MRSEIRSPISLAFRSYTADLQNWSTRISINYAVAVGLLFCGTVAVMLATGISIAAVFHVIEVRYGIYIAYAAVGGFFLLVGLIALLAGGRFLKQPIPPVPRPHRQLQMIKRSITAPVAISLMSKMMSGNAKQVDPVTKGLAAAAAVTLIGWIAVSHFRSSAEANED